MRAGCEIIYGAKVMIAKLIYWFTGFLKCRIIDSDGHPYLERYYLCTILDKRFFIHRFMDSDPDRGVHDHPWKWAVSLILAGGYNEIIMEVEENFWYVYERTKSAPALNFISGDVHHRILLDKKKRGKTWTLFMHGPRDKGWGFTQYKAGEDGMVMQKEYFPLDLKVERKVNEHWWQRADAKTGRQLRKN